MRPGLRSLPPLLALRARPARPRSSMAAPDVEELPPRVGFKRAEMYTEPLAGTVKLHAGHLFLCSGSAARWPHETSESGLHAALCAALAAAPLLPGGAALKTTLYEASAEGDTEGDLLYFDATGAAGLRVRAAPAADAGGFDFAGAVARLLAGRDAEPVAGPWLFVCAHARRDKRCGACGPVLATALRAAAFSAPGPPVAVRLTSHIGGHAFAGNVIAFSPAPTAGGRLLGEWYGYVTPADAPAVVAAARAGSRLVGRLWRGALGMAPDEAKAAAAGGCGGC